MSASPPPRPFSSPAPCSPSARPVAAPRPPSLRSPPASLPAADAERVAERAAAIGVASSTAPHNGRRKRRGTQSKAGEEGEEEVKLIRPVGLHSGDGHSVEMSAISASSHPSSFSQLSSVPLSSSLSSSSLSTHFRALMLDASADGEAEDRAEMLDYDAAEDVSHGGGGRSDTPEWVQSLITESLRFVITATVGVGIGLMGYAISRAVRSLIAAHVAALDGLMTRDSPISAFLFTLAFSSLFTASAAATVTFGSWHVIGSGVGRLNAFLSGVSSARSLTLRTLVFKVVGLVCSVSSGMKLGMEGPFIHLGAMMGLHISHLLLAVFHVVLPPLGLPRALLKAVSGVKDERVFISGGAAAGFSVAFNAPIAGLLYVQDGASAYWNGEYTFRSFICTMVAVTTLNLCYLQSSGSLPSRGLIDLEDQPTTTIYLAEFWGFAALGVSGGLLGALFTAINIACEKRRLFYLGHKRIIRMVDALVCSAGAVLLSFALPFLFPCASMSGQCASPLRCLRFQCGPEQFSPLATFFFTVPEESIRILFDRQLTAAASHSPDVGVLALFCAAYFLLAALSYGSAVPGGLFIPSIIIGATYGRIVGILSSDFLLPADSSGLSVNPGVYAVLGAASMLGGVTRMTLPISVMMIEITSDAQFLIPIMLVVILAKVVADQCIGALYAEHLRMEGLLMVFGDRIPRTLRSLKAREMMNRGGVVHVAVLETAERLAAILATTTHNAFPVVDFDSRLRRGRVARSRAAQPSLHRSQSDVRDGEEAAVGPVFLGLIQRRHLSAALHVQRSHPSHSADAAEPSQSRARTPGTEVGSPSAAAALPSLSALPSAWPSFSFSTAPTHPPPPLPPPALPSSASPSLALLDLSPYVDEGAYIVSEEMSARQVWALFRSLGMRHLVVVNKRHQPVGMITRRDAVWHAVADVDR